jgi:hypothetical protein
VGAFGVAVGLAVGLGWACTDDSAQDCPVGFINCPCTLGGSCDLDLVCLTGTCVDLGGVDDGGTSSSPSTSGASAMATSNDPSDPTNPTSGSVDSTGGATDTGVTTGPSILLDVGGGEDTTLPPKSGCTAIDLLFVLDGSASMNEERAALGATGAFSQIILTLEGINGGGVDYRIGVTDDDDHGFLVPPGWLQPNPWFESSVLTDMEIANAFNGAVGQVGGIGGAPTGCEHVLTSGVDLLDGDLSGFLRDEALLVLVLVTDVDDYGAYDQMGGNTCKVGCGTPPDPVAALYDALVTLKAGQADGVAGIVVAGDPTAAAGFNFCNQPGSCGCVEVFPGLFDCDVFHATRLYDFATMLGGNGVASDLCNGPASVPTAVDTALNSQIDLACMMFEPEG